MDQTEATYPSGRSSARDRIMDAAEQEFAEFGFAGASLRRLAEAAQVAPAQVHYHFGSKDGLFDAVLRRRAEIINRMREDALAAMPNPGLEEILYVMCRPALAPEAGGANYARIMIAMLNGGADQRRRVEGLFEPTARRFIEAILQAAPGLDRAGATQGYLLCAASLQSVMACTGRTDRLMGAISDRAHADALGDTVRFAAAGLRAMEAAAISARSEERPIAV